MARPQKVSDEEIIEAARACILEFGPGVATATIAERVDVSAQALLKRFGGKDNLVLAALDPLLTMEWEKRLPDAKDARPLVEQLRDVAQVGAMFFPRTICAGYAMKWSMIPAADREAEHTQAPVAVVERIADWMASLAERGVIRTVDFHTVSLAFLGAIQVYSVLQHSLSQTPIPATRGEYLDTVAELYTGMLSAGRTRATASPALH